MAKCTLINTTMVSPGLPQYVQQLFYFFVVTTCEIMMTSGTKEDSSGKSKHTGLNVKNKIIAHNAFAIPVLSNQIDVKLLDIHPYLMYANNKSYLIKNIHIIAAT